ncbi:MAG TPA: HAD-IA family hydrolase [Reyranella sp.]|nr:HAD-IA family hydrolase [Reyranella sp.]
MRDVLLLDAMGVLYEAGDDVADLLVPFVRAHGDPPRSDGEIEAAYLQASLGRMDPAAFWRSLGVRPDLEDCYLAGHRLIDGTVAALAALEAEFSIIACLSNDVAEWSVKLRRRFGLERWISPWFLSGEIGARKPDERIYAAAIRGLGVEPSRIVLVDDRPKNLDAARTLGFCTVLFDVRGEAPPSSHRHIRRLADLVTAR